jgi:hypothetical protein
VSRAVPQDILRQTQSRDTHLTIATLTSAHVGTAAPSIPSSTTRRLSPPPAHTLSLQASPKTSFLYWEQSGSTLTRIVMKNDAFWHGATSGKPYNETLVCSITENKGIAESRPEPR